MLLVNRNVLSGLKMSKMVILTSETKNVADKSLKTTNCKQLADQLNVTREAVSIRLKAMGKIQKAGKWVPHQLNETQQENRKTSCEMALARHKTSHFFIEL